ncbi:MAG: penicillin-binding protein 2 [Candidatus Margulisiibacteriota bacterium]
MIKINRNKNIALTIVFILIFSALFLRLFYLQIIQHHKLSDLSIDNAAKIVSDPAPRGIIYDRKGKAIVENQPVFSVHVLPYILNKKPANERKYILNKLSILLGDKIDYKVSATEPIIVKDHIQKEIAIRIQERRLDLDGVVVRTSPVRRYPYGSAACHVLGYIGEIQRDDLLKLKEEGYRIGDFIGKDGLEKVYDKQLRGIDGGKKIEVDVYGNPLRILESLEPIPGADMQTTLDINLQMAVEKALGAKAGAVVVMDPKTGEILALTSHPNYDPNLFVKPMEKGAWASLNSAYHPFMNRALAIYPPGSTFKVVTLTAALEGNFAKSQEMFNCPGYYRINNRIAKCWKETGHWAINIVEGLVQSCDVVFYQLGMRIGPDELASYAEKFGLGSRTGIDLPQEKKGLVPSKSWKKDTLHEPWYEGESMNYGIGQGYVQVTPMQMAGVYAGIATGAIPKPYIVTKITDRNGITITEGKTRIAYKVPLSDKNIQIIRNALREVVKRATGIVAKVPGIPAAGKTGTAENPGLPHAWFICYAPYDNPEIVIVAFVEHGQHGDQASASVARDILTWYRDNRLEKKYAE